MMEHRCTLYVGGLAPEVTAHILRVAFIPFGPIVDVDVPLQAGTQHNKGFGFVQFEFSEDAEAARDNMHEAELYGKCLNVDISQYKKKTGSAVWNQ
mmetsp:Transcript_6033/g.6928  ORF Transcript_6033/g.6928 Transcript_6033/m.6928 type:complete len:96 (+) Transcript_6033:161-448(+)